MLKFYQKLRAKIEVLKVAAQQQALEARDFDGQSMLSWGLLWLIIKILFHEVLLSVTKFLIIVTKNSGESFRILFAPEAGQIGESCQLSYRSFKIVYRKIRVFSAAATTVLVIATIITSLVLNMFFGGSNGAFAGTYTWLQTDWNPTATSGSTILHPSTGTTYDAKDAAGIDNSVAGQVSLAATNANIQNTNNGDTSTGFNQTGANFDSGKMVTSPAAVTGGAGADASLQLGVTNPAGTTTIQTDDSVNTNESSFYKTGSSFYANSTKVADTGNLASVQIKDPISWTDGVFNNNCSWLSDGTKGVVENDGGINVRKFYFTSFDLTSACTISGAYPVKIYVLGVVNISAALTVNAGSNTGLGAGGSASGSGGGGGYGTGGGTCGQGTSPGGGGGTYGNAAITVLYGGSRGGSCDFGQGGAGGGALNIKSASVINMNGSINASGFGGGSYAGGGSGGAIKLEAPEIDGTGSIGAYGGNAQTCNGQNSGGYGRVRLEKNSGNYNLTSIDSVNTVSTFSSFLTYPATAKYASYLDSTKTNGVAWKNFIWTKAESGSTTQTSLSFWVKTTTDKTLPGDFSTGCLVTPTADTTNGERIVDLSTCYASGAVNPAHRYLWYEATLASSADHFKTPQLNDVKAIWTDTYQTSGTYVSPVLALAQKVNWGAVDWNISGASAATMTVRARSCDDAACSSAGAVNEATNKVLGSCGSLTKTGSLTSASPNCITNGDQYIQYQIAFTGGSRVATPSLDYITLGYSYYPSTDQTLTSSAFNTNDPYNSLNKISWTNLGAGTAKFQVRTGGSQSELNTKPWCGPDNGIVGSCNSGTYFTASNGSETVDDVSNDKSADMWMQYKMFLASTTGADTPKIDVVQLEYNFNEPPYFNNTTIAQSATGKVDVSYQIKDVENGKNGNVSNLLFYQPDQLTLGTGMGDGSSIADIVLDNPTNFVFASSGKILIGNELISYAGVSGNGTTTVTLTGITRAQHFDAPQADFPTEGVMHASGEAVWIKAEQVTGDMGTLAVTNSFVAKSAIWNPALEPHLNGKDFANMKMKMVASDGYADYTSRTRSSMEINNTLDLKLPTITSITTSAPPDTYFKSNGAIPLTFTASEDLSAASGTANLNSGGTCVLALGNPANTVTCTYTVGLTDDTHGAPLTVTAITGTITDTKNNVRTDPAMPTGVNNIDTKNLMVDNVVPVIIEPEVTPKDNAYINSVTSASDVSYTLSENVLSGSIVFARTGGNAAPDKTCVLKNNALNTGSHYNLNLSDANNSCVTAVDLNNGTTYTMTIAVTDFANNPSAPIVRSNITFDTTPPTLPAVTISSNNAITNTGAKVGDTVTVAFTASEPLHPTNIPVVTIDGQPATVQNAAGNSYTATYKMLDSDVEGVIPFSIIFSDRAENPGTPVTAKTTGANVIFDKTVPRLQAFTSDATASVAGDENTWYPTLVTSNVDVHAAFAENDLLSGSITLKLNTTPTQHEMTLDAVNNAKLSGIYTIQQGENIGALQVASISSYSATDWVGNTITDIPVLGTIDNFVNKLIRVDTSPPELMGFSAPAGFYNAGDHILLTATYNKDIKPGSASFVTVKLNTDNSVERNEAIVFNNINGATLTHDYVVGADHNAQDLHITTITEQSVFDLKSRQLISVDPPANNIHSVLVDTIPPQAIIADGNDIKVGPVVSDRLTVDVTETNPGTYRYVESNNCGSVTPTQYDNGTSLTNNEFYDFSTDTGAGPGKYVCVRVIDSASNAVYLASANPLNIDAIQPTGTVDIATDTVQLTSADTPRDITGLNFRIVTFANPAAPCDFVAAPWTPVAATFPLPVGHVKACVQFKDQAGNVSQTYDTTAPETPMSFQLNDISNLVLSPIFRGAFLSWQTPIQTGTGGVDFYQIMHCDVASSGDDCNPTDELAKVQAESGENFYVNNGLSDRKYCYRVRFKDNHSATGNYSAFSATQCFVPGVAPIVSNTQVNIPNGAGDITISDVTRTSARIAFRTEDANASNAALPTTATVALYATADLQGQAVASYTDSTTNYNVNHVINLTNLESGKFYYLRITATDSSDVSNPNRSKTLDYNGNANSNLKLATLGKLSTITMLYNDGGKVGDPKVLTDSKAVISFNTDQLAKCAVYYENQSYASIVDSASRVGKYQPLPIIETDYNGNHSVHLPDLIPSTAYYYTVQCFDDLTPATFVYAGEYSFTTLEKKAVIASGDGTGADTTAPTISNVAATNIIGESATITWDTNEVANSSVAFGLVAGTYNDVASNYIVNSDVANYVTSHSVIVNNLIPSTRYYFVAMSLDAAGNIAKSAESSFTTKAPSSLSSVRVTFKNLSQAVVTWHTDKDTTSLVEYGLTTIYGQKNENKTNTKDHEITIAGLQSKQIYHFRVKSTDAQGNLFASTDNTFEPKSPPQIDALQVIDVADHGAKITFNTDVPTDALVTYVDVADAQNSGSQGKPEFMSKHEMELKNLTSGATYSLKIRVRDEAGNETEETFPSFQTSQDENAPKIDQIKTSSALSQTDKVQSIISWLTDEGATSTLAYREGRDGKDTTVNASDKLATNHISVITSFKPGTVYYFRVKARDEAGNESTSTEYAILTPRRKENIVQIILANFQDIFKWAQK